MAVWIPCAFGQLESEITPADPTSIQRALDRHPGQRLFVPAGDYLISQPIRIGASNSGLWGPGRLIQSNPEANIIEMEGVDGVELRDLTLMRAPGREETHRPAVRMVRGADLTLDNVRILENRGDLAAVFAAYCQGLVVRHCFIQNYSRIAIDDRTTIPNFGFAFNAINGTGIMVRHCTGSRLEYNRIVEQRLLPTPELKARHRLGSFTAKNATKGAGVSPAMWDAEYFNGWHQGAALQVTKGETTDLVQIVGNYIENAAQGIDIHGDHVIVAHNIVNNAFIGMKAVHGSRNVIIVGNQFSRNDLWSIQLQPGTASHAAYGPAEASAPDPVDPEGLTWPITRPGANIDGHSIVANNVVSDFGYGTAHWMWPPAGSAPIQFNVGPPTAKGPPLANVLFSGNIVYDTGRDRLMVDGESRLEPPRYAHAVRVAAGERGPSGLHFRDNIFHPGTAGVSNLDLPP